MSTSKSILSRLALACALVAGIAVVGSSFQTAAANDFSARRLSAPVHDAGDPTIRDMPVVRGHR